MRDLFLLDPNVIFLNHGSFGACPRPVFERYQAWQLELERQPVEFLGRRYADLLADARAELGAHLGTRPDNLVFVPNATAGLNTVARSLQLQAGDEILMTDHEYGALQLMWEYIARQTGAEIVVQQLPLPLLDDASIVEAIWRGVSPRTRVIFLSHITSPTALVLPIEPIIERAHKHGILTMIDGAHAPGQISVNLAALGADFYSGNCHKWLCAPKGSAFLYVDPKHHTLIDPLIISWGWDKNTLVERTRWQGTRDIAAYLSVPTAIQFQRAHQWETLCQQCTQVATQALLSACEILGGTPIAMPRYNAQMAAIPLPSGTDAEALKVRLYDDYHIEIPVTQHRDYTYLRISIQAYNTMDDVTALLSALKQIF